MVATVGQVAEPQNITDTADFEWFLTCCGYFVPFLKITLLQPGLS
jgi:hypothetical protein